MYRLGYRYEWELTRKLRLNGLAAVRIAGSGKSVDAPDIIAGYRGHVVSIQVKTTRGETLYISEEDMNSLIGFSKLLGSEPWFYVVYRGRRLSLLVKPEVFERTNRGVKLTFEKAREEGISVSEFASVIKAKACTT